MRNTITTVAIDQETKDTLMEAGGGNVSKGVRVLAAKLRSSKQLAAEAVATRDYAIKQLWRIKAHIGVPGSTNTEQAMAAIDQLRAK